MEYRKRRAGTTIIPLIVSDFAVSSPFCGCPASACCNRGSEMSSEKVKGNVTFGEVAANSIPSQTSISYFQCFASIPASQYLDHQTTHAR